MCDALRSRPCAWGGLACRVRSPIGGRARAATPFRHNALIAQRFRDCLSPDSAHAAIHRWPPFPAQGRESADRVSCPRRVVARCLDRGPPFVVARLATAPLSVPALPSSVLACLAWRLQIDHAMTHVECRREESRGPGPAPVIMVIDDDGETRGAPRFSPATGLLHTRDGRRQWPRRRPRVAALVGGYRAPAERAPVRQAKEARHHA